jgi:hypothetical protein
MADIQVGVVDEVLAQEALRVTELRGPTPPGETPADILHKEVAKIDAELQNLGDPDAIKDQPDPRLLFPTIREAVEDYAQLLYGQGIYKVTFSLDPNWISKVSVEAYGDIQTTVDADDPESGAATLTPKHLGSFELMGDTASSVGYAVDSLKRKVQTVLRKEVEDRQCGIDALLETLAFMESAPTNLEGMWPKADLDEGEERLPPVSEETAS